MDGYGGQTAEGFMAAVKKENDESKALARLEIKEVSPVLFTFGHTKMDHTHVVYGNIQIIQI